MAARLAVSVVLRDPDGDPRTLLEGEEVPDWAEGLVGAHCLAGEVDSDPVGPPAKAGPHATVDAWATYAEANGVDAPEDASRADLIAACTVAGVPTE